MSRKIPFSSFIIALSVFLTSSQSMYQVLELSSTDTKFQSKTNEFENSEVKVSYNFWSNGGLVYFKLTNKLDSSIFIDWNKSHLIYNGISYDYWFDTEETNSFYSSSSVTNSNSFADAVVNIFGNSGYGSGRSSSYTRSSKVSVMESSKTKPKRIIQIPPKSSVIISKFSISKTPFYDCNFNLNNSSRREVNSKNFTKEESPLEFRNYLTISKNEDFNNSIIIDNDFYISSISFMSEKLFLGKSSTKKDCDLAGHKILTPIKEKPYKKPNSFYVKIKSN